MKALVVDSSPDSEAKAEHARWLFAEPSSPVTATPEGEWLSDTEELVFLPAVGRGRWKAWALTVSFETSSRPMHFDHVYFLCAHNLIAGWQTYKDRWASSLAHLGLGDPEPSFDGWRTTRRVQGPPEDAWTIHSWLAFVQPPRAAECAGELGRIARELRSLSERIRAGEAATVPDHVRSLARRALERARTAQEVDLADWARELADDLSRLTD
jgi:hypothetical protein